VSAIGSSSWCLGCRLPDSVVEPPDAAVQGPDLLPQPGHVAGGRQVDAVQRVPGGALHPAGEPGSGPHGQGGDIGKGVGLHRRLQAAAERALDCVVRPAPQRLCSHRHLLVRGGPCPGSTPATPRPGQMV